MPTSSVDFPVGTRVRLRTSTTDAEMVGTVVGHDGDWIVVDWPETALAPSRHLSDGLTLATPGLPGPGIRRCGSPLHTGDRDLPATAAYYYLRPASHGARAGEPYDVCRTCIAERDRRYRAARRAGTRVATPRAVRRTARAAAPVVAPVAAPVAAAAPTNRQFGIEIEFIGASHSAVIRELAARGISAREESYNHRTPRGSWKLTTDSSCGSELVSPPLAGADGRTQVTGAMEALRAAGARVNSDCGLHVHHDMAGLDNGTIARIIETYAASQDAINWFVDRSRRDNSYCRPVSTDDVVIRSAVRAADSGTLADFASHAGGRFRSINVRAYARYGTLEIRQHQGTLNARKALAWIDFGQAIVAAAADGIVIRSPEPDDMITRLVDVGGLASDTATYLRNRAGAFQARAAAPRGHMRAAYA